MATRGLLLQLQKKKKGKKAKFCRGLMENKPLAFLIHINNFLMSLCTQLQTLLNVVSISVHKYKKAGFTLVWSSLEMDMSLPYKCAVTWLFTFRPTSNLLSYHLQNGRLQKPKCSGLDEAFNLTAFTLTVAFSLVQFSVQFCWPGVGIHSPLTSLWILD